MNTTKTGCLSLKLIGVKVPDTVSVGESASIHCLYDLQGGSLYSLKWHFNGREFYRLMNLKLSESSASPVVSSHYSSPPTSSPSSSSSSSSQSSSSSRSSSRKKNHHKNQQQQQIQQPRHPKTAFHSNVRLTPMEGLDVDVSRPSSSSLVSWTSFISFLCLSHLFTSKHESGERQNT